MNRRGCIKSSLDRLSGEQLLPCKHLASCPNKKFRHSTSKESTRRSNQGMGSFTTPWLQVAQFKSQGNISHSLNPACADAMANSCRNTSFFIGGEGLPRPPFPYCLTQQQSILLDKAKEEISSSEQGAKKRKNLNVAALTA